MTLAAPPSARARIEPRVQPAANRDICRGSTDAGSSPGAGSGSGPVALGLNRIRSVTGDTPTGRPLEKARAEATVIVCASSVSTIEASSKACTCGLIE